MSHAYTFATTKDTGNIALQMALYVIAMHVNVETGTTYCGIKMLMREARVKSDRTMRNYIKQLEDAGFIKREKRFRKNGGKSTDLIELVGFLEWRARDGIPATRVVGDAAGFTGGGQNGSGVDRERQELPEPSGTLSAGPSGTLATGECDQSSNGSGYHQDDARARTGTDGRLPFTADVIDEVYSLGLDPEVLIQRYRAAAKRTRIADPSAYLLRMARDDVAKRTGVTAEDVKRCSSRNRGERKANLAAACGAFDKPSTAAIESHTRRRGKGVVDAALATLARRTFKSQADADRAFFQEIANVSLRPKREKVAV